MASRSRLSCKAAWSNPAPTWGYCFAEAFGWSNGLGVVGRATRLRAGDGLQRQKQQEGRGAAASSQSQGSPQRLLQSVHFSSAEPG
jgi:hypothetical protein